MMLEDDKFVKIPQDIVNDWFGWKHQMIDAFTAAEVDRDEFIHDVETDGLDLAFYKYYDLWPYVVTDCNHPLVFGWFIQGLGYTFTSIKMLKDVDSADLQLITRINMLYHGLRGYGQRPRKLVGDPLLDQVYRHRYVRFSGVFHEAGATCYTLAFELASMARQVDRFTMLQKKKNVMMMGDDDGG